MRFVAMEIYYNVHIFGNCRSNNFIKSTHVTVPILIYITASTVADCCTYNSCTKFRLSFRNCLRGVKFSPPQPVLLQNKLGPAKLLLTPSTNTWLPLTVSFSTSAFATDVIPSINAKDRLLTLKLLLTRLLVQTFITLSLKIISFFRLKQYILVSI
ncbi:hypothetical protein PCARR_b0719 [Pseudoalteromonas carrageenovora IAM 12662]|uniref:Uncharacterized protein n=1 Tax=Pseudoalteromonas carrageenovora IAM 12662 TaxID=1314868 RepID=A0ABR9EVW5_PSEVC|nr:hypothetical protein [Pseudoalteromonas carrageenovora IAM 12662]